VSAGEPADLWIDQGRLVFVEHGFGQGLKPDRWANQHREV